MVETLLEILKYTVPAVVVLVATWLVVNKFLVTEIEKKQLAIFGKQTREVLMLRMQAYERLTHFVERIHPHALIGRHYLPNATAQEVQLNMVKNIREEYEHNLSQQIYVSREVWETVKNVKEQEISMINQIAVSLGMGASAKELIAKISEFAMNEDTEVPSDIALHIINGEAKKVLMANE